MKRWFVFSLMMLGLFLVMPSVSADGITVEIDGEIQSFDQPPVLQEGRTLVPLRGIFEQLGAEVTWIQEERRIEATTGERDVRLTVGSRAAQVNGATVALDVPAEVRNGRTLVPLRFIGEALGAEVHWDGDRRRVSIYAETSPEDRVVTEGDVGSSKRIAEDDTEADLLDRGVTHVRHGDSVIFIGYRQVSRDNQDPVMVRFDQGEQAWFRDDIERSGDDGQGYGLVWDGGESLYAVFSATGTQGSADQDYRRYTRDGWLRDYGRGGGAKVAVILKMQAADGEATAGTFLTSRLSDGRTNSLSVEGLYDDGQTLTVGAQSWFRPLDENRSPMNVDHLGGSPFTYQIVFNRDLTEALSTRVR